ncbi:unnamed protein product [Rangifer tarandus platyrhynchus]|uniref:Uncharacterized protein n=1 Tax=Rangifer tarandus platyrhynchus TaxID=3082113 RepID=A0ABN8XLR0_RANTA|nr:unnamed protein product [Rangifer tarandus platyrhynchus]
MHLKKERHNLHEGGLVHSIFIATQKGRHTQTTAARSNSVTNGVNEGGATALAGCVQYYSYTPTAYVLSCSRREPLDMLVSGSQTHPRRLGRSTNERIYTGETPSCKLCARWRKLRR